MMTTMKPGLEQEYTKSTWFLASWSLMSCEIATDLLIGQIKKPLDKG